MGWCLSGGPGRMDCMGAGTLRTGCTEGAFAYADRNWDGVACPGVKWRHRSRTTTHESRKTTSNTGKSSLLAFFAMTTDAEGAVLYFCPSSHCLCYVRRL